MTQAGIDGGASVSKDTVAVLMVAVHAAVWVFAAVIFAFQASSKALTVVKRRSSTIQGAAGEDDAGMLQHHGQRSMLPVPLGAVRHAWLHGCVTASLCSAMLQHGGARFVSRPALALRR